MNILIVDDQLSVLKGITSGVNFANAGIDHVFTATNVTDAKKIIEANDIVILLSDIEMPGENGLSLSKWVYENYPSIIRILLTSHASFTYAKESIKFGCFDYIIQPAPYHEIEDVIMRAVSKLLSDRQINHYYNMEFTSNIVRNLFSQNPTNKQQSVISLNQMGYVLKEESNIQAIIVDIYPYSESESPTFSDLPIFITLLESANMSFNSPAIYPLVCLNRYKQFVVLLFCNDNSLDVITADAFKFFYQSLCKEIGPELSCYATPRSQLINIRDTIFVGHQLLINNVAKKPGMYFSNKDGFLSGSTNILENIARWTKLLANNQFSLLEENIFSYLNFNVTINRLNLEILCEFHQQLTKIFFVYSYQQNIDIMGLFTDEYNYNDYMNSFKDVKSLMQGISFIINSIANVSSTDDTKDDAQRAKEYILANISKDISVKDVADYVHLSPEYFSKLFKKEMGENVKNYILRIKVDAAKDLLENPNIPVSMVASELGYSNFSHFTQMFKKHENVTPSEYRRQALKHE
ncbi:MAG: AraC family transcriptional regulator [Herbinix sp.]|jgi:YesN/AraC family two-component response regulator|nr:AraC family transcriptional regulator [Herbinix sp.]